MGISYRNRNKGKCYKDGTKKPANWEYRFEVAKVEGQRKTESKAGFSTKREAEIAGNKALAEYNRAGSIFEPSETSVADYLDYWVESYCLMNVADSTLCAYRNIIKNHIKPRIGKYRLCSVTTKILQDMVNSIYVERGFSYNFLNSILKVLKGAFKYAKLTAGLIENNPALEVHIPKASEKTNSDGENGEEIIILSKESVSRLLERFRNSYYQYYAMLTAYYTGLRVSEVYGLTWECVDFDKKQIKVNKISKKIEKEGKTSEGKRKRGIRGKATTRWYVGACKTKSSYRTIDVGETLIEALKEYYEWQKENEKLYGELYTKCYYIPEVTETHKNVKRIVQMQDIGQEIPLERAYPVFIKENGEYHGTDSVKYVSKVANYELGIHYNFHAFRHTHATMLIENDVPIKAVSKRLGHSSVRTTLEIYVHVTSKMNEKAVSAFEMAGNLEDNTIVSIEELKRNKKDKDNKLA